MRRYCPFCFERLGSTGSRDNVSIDLEKHRYHCWRCGASGWISKKVAQLLDVPLEYVLSQSDINTLLKNTKKTLQDAPNGYVPLYPRKEVFDTVALLRYIQYLTDRGVEHATIARHRIGAVICPDKDLWYLAGSIVFPLLDSMCLGYVCRALDGSGYRSAKGMDRKNCLYNANVMRELTSKNILYVTEGVFDCLAFAKCGRHAVATLGTSVTDGQLSRLANADCSIVFALDGDAWKISRMLARRLRLRTSQNVGWIHIPPGRDPADVKNILELPVCS